MRYGSQYFLKIIFDKYYCVRNRPKNDSFGRWEANIYGCEPICFLRFFKEWNPNKSVYDRNLFRLEWNQNVEDIPGSFWQVPDLLDV